MVVAAKSTPLVHFAALSEFAPEPVNWLWSNRLAHGKLALLDGDPGAGKSLVTLDLCARVTLGREFPDGAGGCRPANVIILNAEDSVADTIKPRLMSLGADMERVYAPRRARSAAVAMRFPSQAAALRAAVEATHARLVVIDPIMAFLDRSVWVCNDASARLALAPLEELAEANQCAVLLVRHLNKSGRSQSLYRGIGSIGFAGACRSVWLIASDPEEKTRRILAQVKNNLAPAQPSLAYTLVTQESGPPLVAWQGTSPLTADALLMQPRAQPEARATPCEQACAALGAFLEAGLRSSRDVWDFAQAEGICEPTLKRAKAKMKIRSERVYVGARRCSYWLLPGQELPDEVKPKHTDDSVDLWLRNLNEKYPPATPIDEL